MSLKSIPNKTHRKAVLLVTEVGRVSVEVTVTAVKFADIRGVYVLSGTPKERIVTSINEITIVSAVTYREGVKTAAVV